MTAGTPEAMVREFHEAFGLAIRDTPAARTLNTELRVELLTEEFAREYLPAVAEGNVVEIADALADMVYVIYGTALDHGIDLAAVLVEVHRSNMSKLGADGKPILRGDGKILKGPNYSPPNIAAVLGLLGDQPGGAVS